MEYVKHDYMDCTYNIPNTYLEYKAEINNGVSQLSMEENSLKSAQTTQTSFQEPGSYNTIDNQREYRNSCLINYETQISLDNFPDKSKYYTITERNEFSFPEQVSENEDDF